MQKSIETPNLFELALEKPSPLGVVFDPSPEPELGESGDEPGEPAGEAAAMAKKNIKLSKIIRTN